MSCLGAPRSLLSAACQLKSSSFSCQEAHSSWTRRALLAYHAVIEAFLGVSLLVWSRKTSMSFSPSRPTSVHVEQAFAPFLNDPGLPFAQVLPAAEIEQAFTEAGVHFGASQRSVFTPALVMWAWLSQVVDPAKSCTAAVLRVSALLLALGRGPCSEDTAAYCRALAKLPAMVLRKLALQVGQRLEEAVPKDWLWQQRPTQLVDGTTVTLADTPENQEAFPQPTGQRPGLGFPMIRMVG